MSEHLGLKIKQLREEKNLPAQQLADLAGIHISQLEMIEQARLVPSMSTLVKLAQALQMRLGTILDGEEYTGPVVCSNDEHHPVVSLSNDNTSARKHVKFHSMAQRKTDRNMDPMMVEVGYADPETTPFSTHEGEEFLYVLEGEAELRYGSEVYPLTAGQSIYYDSLVPHCLTTRTPQAPHARVIAVTYIPY